MISAASSVIIAAIFGLKTPFFAPLVFLSRFLNKEISAMLFFIYCSFLGYEFFVSDLFEIGTVALAMLLSTLLLLDESISSRRRNLADYLLAAFAIFGLVNPNMVLPVLISAFFNILLSDRPKFGFLAVTFTLFFFYIMFLSLREIVEDWNLPLQLFALSSILIIIFLVSNLIDTKFKKSK